MIHVYAGTGHRPTKLGGYGLDVYNDLVNLAMDYLKDDPPTHIISGMALGWDQALAEAATKLDIPWTAAIPCIGQESRWPQNSQKKYRSLLEHAQDKIIVSNCPYNDLVMRTRNEWMVNNCTEVLALWDGSPGGTSSCVRYAMKKDIEIINLWDRWLKLKRSKSNS